MTSPDRRILKACRDIVLGTGIPPHTRLSSAVASGNMSAVLDDPTMIGQTMPMFCWDSTGEEPLVTAKADAPVSNPAALTWDGASNPVNFVFRGLGYEGFRYAHDAGTLVYTNLFEDGLASFDNKLGLIPAGHGVTMPVIWIDGGQESGYLASFDNIEPNFVVTVSYRLSMIQPRGIGPTQELMDSEQWNLRIRTKAREDMDAIAVAFIQTFHLEDREGIGQALALGDRVNAAAPLYQKLWSQQVVNQSGLQFSARMTLPVRGEWLELAL